MEALRKEYNLYSWLRAGRYFSQKVEPVTKQMELNQGKQDEQDDIRRKQEGKGINIGEEQLVEMIERANSFLQSYQLELIWEIKSDRKDTIKLVNKNTQQIIIEIPSKKTGEFINLIWQLSGLFVDVKV